MAGRMISSKRHIATLTLVALAGCGGGSSSTGPVQQASTEKALAFVSCPQFRDLKTDVIQGNSCWVVEHNGQKYSLGNAIGTPQLGHSVLVEAVDSGSTDTFCGGRVLSQARTSVLPEVNSACQTILEPEGVTLPAPAPFQIPTVSMDPPQPYVSTSYALFFPHQSATIGTTLTGSFHVQVETAANLALRGNAAAVVVTGHAASTILDDGTVAPESTELASERAQKVAQALRMLGVPASLITVQVSPVVPAADGANAWKGRSVTVDVKLG